MKEPMYWLLGALIISVNVWGWLTYQPASYEFDVRSYDDYTITRKLSSDGAAGWHPVSCRRALDAEQSGIYECIMERRR